MTSLAERAAAAAGRADTATPDAPPVGEPDAEQYTGTVMEDLPDLTGYVPREGEDWDMVPVHVAWLRVRRDIEYIGKGDAYKEQGKTKYNFRGYERTVAAFGPVTLKHGVSVIPHRLAPSHRDAKSGKGTPMRETTTKITWRVYGPRGDWFEMESEGESLDYADKGTAKAQTIAQRVVLLVAGLIPTGAPDSDESNIERGHEAPARSAESYRDEILNKDTSPARLQQINYELTNLRMLTRKVQNETGEWETLDDLGGRIYRERTGGGS
ncbi:ERF family protein [Streptomyces inhibens]|uniref:ERF family protein n=1 Tax=Streptomyces inhibens TaxID=2293571 RepID=UPI0036B37620